MRDTDCLKYSKTVKYSSVTIYIIPVLSYFIAEYMFCSEIEKNKEKNE